MDYDPEKVDDAVLALLYLTTFKDKDAVYARAWKGHDWGAMSRLYEKGYIGDPKGQAKSVLVSPEGERRSEELFWRYFGK